MGCTHQTPLSLQFFIQESWSGLPFSVPWNLPDAGIEPSSPALAGGFFTAEPPGKPVDWLAQGIIGLEWILVRASHRRWLGYCFAWKRLTAFKSTLTGKLFAVCRNLLAREAPRARVAPGARVSGIQKRRKYGYSSTIAMALGRTHALACLWSPSEWGWGQGCPSNRL